MLLDSKNQHCQAILLQLKINLKFVIKHISYLFKKYKFIPYNKFICNYIVFIKSVSKRFLKSSKRLLPAWPAEILASTADTLMSFQLEYGDPLNSGDFLKPTANRVLRGRQRSSSDLP